ncbi:glycerophosphodiester phosphodiesterase family protein [Limnovirga soli]|uniref:Glycerophosphodiester phosphodiesterase n=1 Tax=Limnovirga soli TaxID=2656915 RepID=A0A8J8FEE8_9BACT|nr:glycerophosphodiester phosphodiesterase family protein [Limnovirga soli]NNV56200.1 glycerophosphodiester phosphodiesterase [Limnovirga soli]
MKAFLSSLFLPLAFILISMNAFTQTRPLPASKNKMVIIAHRGDHTNAPENSLAACQNAIDAGADFVEIDLRTTKDSALVIMHDATVDRMTGNKGLVKDFTLAQLQTIQLTQPQHAEWGTQPIPTFKQVLALCKGKINIYLDYKEAAVVTAYQEICNAGMEKNIVVYINQPAQFSSWRNIAPQMPLMISLPKAVKTKEEMFQLLDSLQIDVLDGDADDYTPATVMAAKEKHIPIWADIQSANENEESWNKALALGFPGLQTDHPKALINFLIKKGLR